MTTLERAVAVWKRCREVGVGISCRECPLYIGQIFSACDMFKRLNDDPKLADELNKREAK